MSTIRLFASILSLSVMVILAGCGEAQESDASGPDTQSSVTAPGPSPTPAPPKGLEPPYPIEDSSRIFTVGGIQIYIAEQGSGPKPAPGSNVVMNYRGTLLDGSEFDSSFDTPGYQDFSLNALIEGWKIALPEVPTGSKIKLIIPPELGYGAAARPGIPANSTLIFDIDLASTY